MSHDTKKQLVLKFDSQKEHYDHVLEALCRYVLKYGVDKVTDDLSIVQEKFSDLASEEENIH